MSPTAGALLIAGTTSDAGKSMVVAGPVGRGKVGSETAGAGAVSGGLLVAGTTSDAGKSVLTAGICRWLHRRGVKVAPVKAQNMSNNSAVTVDGGEIGRAQAMQARAAGLSPHTRFNPVLLKPGSDRTSQLVVRGRVVDNVGARDYFTHREQLATVVADELRALRTEFDAVIVEGAGSPAEINLRATDIANMGLARAAELPVVVVGDIDRGGLLAHLYGTLAVLEADDQRLICGFLVNKFRGDPSLLAPGLSQLQDLTGRPTYGVIPYTDGLWLDAEDSVSVLAHRVVGDPQTPRGGEWLRVAAVRLPRISNSTDVEALACEPGVLVRWVSDPADLADAITEHARLEKPVLGVCGGFQMLCRRIDDSVESRAGRVEGLALLDADIEFESDKTLCHHEVPLHGYEIHHGHLTRSSEDEWLAVGIRRGAVYGTHWHGLLDNDDVRREWLTAAATAAGRRGFVVADDVDVRARRDAQLDAMADLITSHVDVDAVLALLEHGPARLPTVATRLTP